MLYEVITYLMTNYLTKDLLLERAVSSSEDGLRAIQSEVNSVLDQTLELSNVALMNSEIRQQIQWGQKKKGSLEEKDDYHLNYSRLIRMLDELLRQYDDFYVTILGKNDFTYTNYSYSDYNPYKLSSQPS